MGYASPKMLSFSQSVNSKLYSASNISKPFTDANPPLKVRGRIPELDQNRDGFVHNALAYSTARFPMCRSTLLSEIVYHNRKAIIEAADPKDISIGVAITQEMVRRGQGTHIVRPFESSYFVTNWSAAWRGLDFSPAVKEDEKERDASAALKAFVFGNSGVASNPQRCKNMRPPINLNQG
jgi:hypothetical protein